ncbi:cysteine hydrolase (plasmid) [Rhodococcus sp. ZPP]|uniref:cysteine hydrolase family protein n=1 Tax=Rhodococcus sp. ZPP TaxID=2749906 RepID=UPI001AD856CB|nr:isochorismatase family cysteine hydrolase [Rhodococcus sp. ZPP]QTJ70255.1 cysteine hydrolase [Rhodococcus sp. ZPP]
MHTINLPNSAIARGRAMGLNKPIEPATTAVITVDFQNFFVADGEPMATEHARDALVNANRVNAAVRDSGGVVVIMQHSYGPPDEVMPNQPLTEQALMLGSPSYELHPDLVVGPGDVRMVKRVSSPLHPLADTQLQQTLEQRGIKTVIITGVASNGCCDCLARDAFQYGFNVVFVSDATSAMSDEEHNATLLNLAIYYAQVLDTDAVVEALQG